MTTVSALQLYARLEAPLQWCVPLQAESTNTVQLHKQTSFLQEPESCSSS